MSVILLSSLLYISSSAAVNNTCAFIEDGVWTCNYIPLDIPDGVKQVHINQFMSEIAKFEVNQTYFMTDNWRTVRYLEFSDDSYSPNFLFEQITFKDYTFRNLKELKELHFHIGREIVMEPHSLSGLQNVSILDFSQCIRNGLNYIMGALNGLDAVPNLEQLLLSQVNNRRQYLNIDREFSKCLKHKPVFYIDLSKTRISVLELQILKDLGWLRKLNFSGAEINIISHANASQEELQHLDLVDMSYAILSELSVPATSNIRNTTLSNVKLPITDRGRHISYILSPKVWNASGVNIVLNNIFVYNTKAWFSDDIKSKTREVIAMDNDLRRLDIELVCNNVDLRSFERLNIANNGLEYMHPSLLACMPSLNNLDLSNNMLHVMFEENIQLFGQLLKGLKNVKVVSLSFNGLVGLPDEFFSTNTLLETINLAENRLTQVHFSLRHLRNLLVLNLASNAIKVLDESSMHSLDALFAVLRLDATRYDTVDGQTSNVTVEVGGKTHFICNIKDNPLLCDKCERKTFISWLVSADYIDTITDNVMCTRDTGEQLEVNQEAVTIVQHVCDRNTRNIILAVIAAVVCIGGTIAVVILYMRKRRVRKERRRNEVIHDLQHDEARFAVFLSYSSDDFNFVEENVVEPLNEGLKEIIGTDRNLVCQGDAEFRLGRYVHNESLRCIELTEVFLCVISNSYCDSNYCDSEFNQALVLNKPVLLMMKNEVDVDLMAPAMQLLFRSNVRVLWENDDGQYRLKTSWQNVCESIVDLASN